MCELLKLMCLSLLIANTFALSVETPLAVCLYNTDTAQYLVSAPDETHYANLRDVTTEPLHRLKNNTHKYWNLFRHGNYHLIQNEGTEEYLVVSNVFESYLSFYRRRVFTSVANWAIDNKRGLWEIEADGHNIFIRNVEYNGYLYDASSGHVLQPGRGGDDEIADAYAFFEWKDSERWRKIFVWNGGNGRKVSSGRWRMVADC